MSIHLTPAQHLDEAHDATLMQRAIHLAEQGRGWTGPHPLVGALVVQEGQVVGEGFQARPGKSQAEGFALDAAGELSRGSTLYVTIEPWLQGPALTRILDAGIRRVVVGITDPHPQREGQAVSWLRAAGLEVEVGPLADAARRLNEVYLKHAVTRRPFVALGTTMSLDGKIATYTGESVYPMTAEAREAFESLRGHHDAVVVTVHNVLQSNPDLTVPGSRHRTPLKIILDALARTPTVSHLLARPSGTGLLRPNTMIVVTRHAPQDRIRALQAAGAEIVVAPETGGILEPRIDLGRLMTILGRRDITSLLFEGHGNLFASCLEAGIVDKLYVAIAPVLIGGHGTLTPVEGSGVSLVEAGFTLTGMRARSIGDHLLVEAYPERPDLLS
jgi:diaminohydroxyphosphoribosylaminopyrimidine deaminase/5-amino-6-(5-phosphoribosylamino)uracil reductase